MGGSVTDHPANQPDGEKTGEELAASGRVLSDAAQRALAEADARRLQGAKPLPPEQDGRGGLEPVRYGDWEVKGLACDF